jgi:hypothetical protein
MAECSGDENMYLTYQDRKWVPHYEPLTTRLINEAYSPLPAGHLGRALTYKAVARDYFWPGMSNDIRKFIRNCNVCGRVKSWRDGKHGLLKPLPIPY